VKGLNLKPAKPPKEVKPPRCEDCKGPLLLSRGWGFCEACWRGISMPIGLVASHGPQKGKEVHLLSMILKELQQDTDIVTANEDLEDELHARRYLVIRDEFDK